MFSNDFLNLVGAVLVANAITVGILRLVGVL